MKKVVVIGGGWSGCAAAYAAARKGCSVALLEKNDHLLGCGLAAGGIYQKARLTVCLEAAAMGAGSFFEAIDRAKRYDLVFGPGVSEMYMYDVIVAERQVMELLRASGADICMESRVVEVEKQGGSIISIALDSGRVFEADAFVDCTGTSGPVEMCREYGLGCVSCVIRCDVFGGRVSIAEKAGVREKYAAGTGGKPGLISNGLHIIKSSVAEDLVSRLEIKGSLSVPVPQGLDLGKGAAGKNLDQLVFVDNGFVKLVSLPYLPTQTLRLIPGFENAVYFDPVGGSRGNSYRFFSIAPRDKAMLVNGTQNLFVAGEKQGMLVGCCEAMVSGLLAGHNAARSALGQELLVLPYDLALGLTIAFSGESVDRHEVCSERVTCSSGPLWQEIMERGLYETDSGKILAKVRAIGLEGVF